MDQQQLKILAKEVNEDEATKAEKVREFCEIFKNHPFIVNARTGNELFYCCLIIKILFLYNQKTNPLRSPL